MAQNPIVTFEIEMGNAFGVETGVIKAELYPEIAPNSVNNFISLIKKGFYDGLIFHRVISGFMRQESCSSAGNCQADEQTLITQLSRPGSRD